MCRSVKKIYIENLFNHARACAHSIYKLDYIFGNNKQQQKNCQVQRPGKQALIKDVDHKKYACTRHTNAHIIPTTTNQGHEFFFQSAQGEDKQKKAGEISFSRLRSKVQQIRRCK